VSLTAIPAQELHWRPISKAQIREWERARIAYERESANYAPRPVVVKRVVVPALPLRVQRRCECGCGKGIAKDNLSGWFRGHRPRQLPRLRSVQFCACGCGEIVITRYSVYLPGHRTSWAGNANKTQRRNAIAEQLARIADPLTRKVLMKELGMA
jgi:hypothetical protein